MTLGTYAEGCRRAKNLVIVADWTTAGFYRCSVGNIPVSFLSTKVVEIKERNNETVVTVERTW